MFTSINKHLNVEAMGATTKVDKIVALSGDVLEKGVMSEIFGNSGMFNSRVSGKQVKEGLTKYLSFVEKREKETYDQMQASLAKIEGKPTERPSSWTTQGLDGQLTSIPKMYSSKAISDHMAKGGSYSDCEMNNYNEAARNYIDTCVEKAYAQTMLSTVKDEENTYLTLRQAAILGIGQSK